MAIALIEDAELHIKSFTQ